MPRWSFYPIADSYWLVAFLAAGLFALLWLVPLTGLSKGRRRVLLALRILVLLMTVIALLRPTLVRTEIGLQSATLVLLADRSRSMDVPDGFNAKTRWTLLKETLAEAAPSLQTLGERVEIGAFTFAEGLQSANVEGGSITLPEACEGDETAIGWTLEEVLREQAGKRLLGVVLLSDGAQRAYAPRDVPPQRPAARLGGLGYPLYTVTFGKDRGLSQTKDVAVEDFTVPPNVFVDNVLTTRARVLVSGYANRSVPVELLFESADGTLNVVAKETLLPTSDSETLGVTLETVPTEPGQFKVLLRVPPREGELVTTNNESTTFVSVLKGGLNVLYVEGALRVEQRDIRRSLDASPDIHVDYLRIDPRRPGDKPGNLAGQLGSGKYRVYFIGDLPANVFSREEMENLTQSVSQGSGLLMLGGYHAFGPGGYGDTPLAAVLPIEIGRLERQGLGEAVRDDLHWPGPIRMRPSQFGRNHFLLRLSDSDNLGAWNRLPPLEGANRFSGIKPNGLVLAEDDQGRPLLVAGQFGEGRVLAFAADTTWLWRMKGFEEYHKRFWRQVVLWLAKKDQTETGGVWVQLENRRVARKDRLSFTAGVRADGAASTEGVVMQANLVLPDGSKRPVKLVRGEDAFQGSLRDLTEPGDYAIEVEAKREETPLGTATSRFSVVEQDLELDSPAADSAQMESLAVASGGEAVAPEELPDLLDRILESAQELEVKTEVKRTYWDTWPFLMLFATVLGLEWFLRKRWNKV